MATSVEKNAAFQIALAVAEAIRALGSVPSGHLYVQLMGQMSLDTYTEIINALKNARLITIEGNLIVWRG